MASPALPILFGGLYAWSMYRRIRRNIGQQPLKPRRAIVSLTILTLISVLVVYFGMPHPNALLGFGGGLFLGGVLGYIGLRLTKFETTDAGHFYTPNVYIGIALSALFIGRMAYRFVAYKNTMDPQSGHPSLFQSPLTLFIMGLTIGYYIVYQTGILIHNHDKNKSAGTTPPPLPN
ncbi:MAG TPA: hypothetical protein VG347_17100 [Verrucomicrobiae bacterium]|nr:hypothetical protein [Verrucomicrobiae bacterium]